MAFKPFGYKEDKKSKSVLRKFIYLVIPIALTIVALTFGVYLLTSCRKGNISSIASHNKSKYNKDELVSLLSQSDPYEGLKKVQELSSSGVSFSEDEHKTINSTTNRFFNYMVLDATKKIKENDFAGAKISIGKLEEFFPDHPRIKNLRFSITDIVPYEGVIEHIFFHPLIVYPERAFPKSGRQTGQDLYMVTVHEFKKVIEELHKNNYILIDITTTFDATYNQDGSVASVKPRKLMLPKGKKPVILSVDDINYYEYMLRDGQNFKLILDKDGNLATYSKDMNGNAVISHDNEIMTIVDAFVDKNPDFSFNNAKGTLGVTGYEGVLGWRVNDRPEKVANYEEEAAGLRKVVAQLKQNGWTFASHSQGHRNTPTASFETISEDTDRWDYIVKPFVGATPVYIYPYGASVPPSDAKFKYLQKHGFAMFCTVQMQPMLKWGNTYGIQARKNIDGIAFNGHGLDHMMNVDAVIDPVRPNVKRKPKIK